MLRTGTVFLVLALLSVSLWAQNATIKGIVNYEKQPAPSAEVALFQSNSFVKGALTDDNGAYRFVGLDAGNYTLVVRYEGTTDTFAISGVKGSETREFNAFLEPFSLTVTTITASGDNTPLLRQDETTSGGARDKEQVRLNPNRGINSVVSQVGGTFQRDEGEGINVRGGRGDGTPVFVDGIRQIGGGGITQIAVEQVEVITGGTPPWYGDLLSGAINITTSRPSSRHQIGAEAVTSQFLDAYGYNLFALNATGPVLFRKDTSGKKLNPLFSYFVSGEFQMEQDDDPSHIGVYTLRDGELDKLHESPLVRVNNNFESSANFVREDQWENVKVKTNNNSYSARANGRLDFSLGNNTQFRVGGFYDQSLDNVWNQRNELFTPDANEERFNRTYRGYARLQQFFSPRDTGSLIKDIFYSLQFDYTRTYQERRDARHGENLFNYGHVGRFNNKRAETYGIVNPGDALYNPEIGTSYWQTNGFLDTAFTFDGSTSSNPLLARYNEQIQEYFLDNPRNLNDVLGFGISPFPPFSIEDQFTTSIVNSADLLNNNGILNGFNTTGLSSALNIYSLSTGMGSIFNSFQKSETELYRATGQANISLGKTGKSLHNIKLGFEFDQRIQRQWYITPTNLWIYARQQANRHLTSPDTAIANILYEPYNNTYLARANPLYIAEQQSNFDQNLRQALGLPVDGTDYINIDALDPDQLKLEYFSPDELFNNSLGGFGYIGYDYLGNRVGNSAEGAFFNDPLRRPQDAFQPTYFAGYIHDKFELDRIYLSLGVRVDRFDANQKVLKDKFSLVPLYNAQETASLLGVELPGNVSGDWVPYVDDRLNPTTILGYRDGDLWYDAQGAPVNPTLLQVNGQVQPHIRVDSVSIDAFTDYSPQVNVMPRISFSFPITDRANFFAHYDVLTQRPPAAARLFYGEYLFLTQNATGEINNPNLQPERTIDYEVGFNQLLDVKGNLALKISAFYREMRDMIQVVRNQNAYPITYDSFENLDFATVKGFSLEFFTKRLGIVQANLAYTLQFAEGTGSSFTSSRGILSGSQGFSVVRTLLPLTFDQRHTIVGNIDLRWLEELDRRGPKIGKGYPFKNFGANLTYSLGSGTPYTRNAIPNQADVQFGVNSTSQVAGTPLGSRLPFTLRLDLRVDKDFYLNKGMKTLDDGTQVAKRGLLLNVYVVFLNLLNTQNVLGVYTYSGLPDDAGFLGTDIGQSVVESQIDPTSFVQQYQIIQQNPNNFNVPRRIRLGLALSF